MTTTSAESETATTTTDTKYSKMDGRDYLEDLKVGDHVVIHAPKKDEK